MYKEIISPVSCSPFLESIWVSRNNGEGGARTILPDNNSDIIIPLHASSEVRYVGYMSRFMIHRPVAGEILLGLRFKPGAIGGMIKEEMNLLTDQVLDLSALGSHSFHKIREEYYRRETLPLDTIEKLLLSCFDDFHLDPLLAESMDLISGSSGNIRISELAERTGVSRRTLEKRFKTHLGKSPKRFAQIERFNTLIHSREPLQTMEYYDQSHMIRELKLLSGKRPSELFS